MYAKTAISMQYRHETDSYAQTHDDNIYRAITVSRGKNFPARQADHLEFGQQGCRSTVELC